MSIGPQNRDAAIVALAGAIDKLSGQVAALMAYVSYADHAPIPENDVMGVRGLAQSISPAPISNGTTGAPALHASQGVERIQDLLRGQSARR